MAKITRSINDDAAQRTSDGSITLAGATEAFGSLSTEKNYLGFRITNVAITNAATIRHAYLKVYVAGIGGASNDTYVLSGEAADNAAAFSSAANNISSRSRTTASFSQRIEDLPGDEYYYFDVTAIVQEIVNRAGWSSGNAMVFIFHTPGSSGVATFSMSEETDMPPEVGILYGDSADSERAPTVSGSGAYTNPNNAFSSNDTYATTDNNQTATQIYESFGIPSLTGNTIDGILVKVEGKVVSASARAQYGVELSWDGGTSWTSQKKTLKVDSTDATFKVGGADAWNHTFTPSELTNANFKVRIQNSFASSTEDSRLDYVGVQVFYSSSSTPVTVTPSVQTATFSQPSPTISAVRNVTVMPSTLSVTSTQPAAGVAIGEGLLPEVQILTIELPAPTVNTVRNLTATPATQTGTLTQPVPTVTIVLDVTVSVTVQSVTASQLAPTVATIWNATTTPAAQPATFSQPNPAVTATRNATMTQSAQTVTASQPSPVVRVHQEVAAGVQTSTFSQPVPSITADRSATVSPGVQGMTFSLPTASITTDSGALVAPSAQSSTFSQPAPVVTAVRNLTLTPNVQSITASQPNPSISAAINVTVSPVALSVTLLQQTPNITTTSNASIAAPVQTATMSQPAASIQTGTTIPLPVNGITASIMSPSVVAVRNSVIAAAVQELLFTQPDASASQIHAILILLGFEHTAIISAFEVAQIAAAFEKSTIGLPFEKSDTSLTYETISEDIELL